MLYESFYDMVFTRHSDGKIRSSIRIQDVCKAGITLSDYSDTINLTDKSEKNNYLYVSNVLRTLSNI